MCVTTILKRVGCDPLDHNKHNSDSKVKPNRPCECKDRQVHEVIEEDGVSSNIPDRGNNVDMSIKNRLFEGLGMAPSLNI